MLDATARLVCVSGDVFGPSFGERFAYKAHSLLERAGRRRGVEDEKRDLLPVLALVLPPHNTHGALERLAGQPQLAIERSIRQTLHEPVGRMKHIPLPRKELPAVPIGPHAIQLLAHPPTSQV